MANEREVLKNLPFSLDGHRISTGASKFEVRVGRERLPWKCYEEPGQFTDKGDWMASVGLEGYGKDSERELLQRLAVDEESSPFLLFLEGNTLASPFAAVGSAALFMTSKTFEVAMTGDAGKIKQWTSQHENSDGTRPYLDAKVIYTNVARTPAPLGAGVTTPAPVTFPALVAGYEAAFTVHVTKITGTGVVKVLAEVLSDTPGFATPLVRGTFLLVSNEDPPSGTDVLGPKALTLVLDGDVTPFAGETQWTVRFTITDTDTDGQVEIMAAASIHAKL